MLPSNSNARGRGYGKGKLKINAEAPEGDGAGLLGEAEGCQHEEPGAELRLLWAVDPVFTLPSRVVLARLQTLRVGTGTSTRKGIIMAPPPCIKASSEWVIRAVFLKMWVMEET